MKILGIETSCDETAAAIVEDGRVVLSNIVASSQELHIKTGGIIPEHAARAQLESMLHVVEEAFKASGCNQEEIDAIAVTTGPGLIGSLLVGIETAKTLAYLWNKPIVPVNHLIGHITACFLKQDSDIAAQKVPEFPAIALVVSGGHTDMILMTDHGKAKWLGGTRDDASGEAFDKIARLLSLPYPGGPSLSKRADNYLLRYPDKKLNLFPRPMIGSGNYDFSFSGLKTSVFNNIKNRRLSDFEIDEYSAEVQAAIADVLVTKTIRAVEKYKPKSLLLAGGVSANRFLRDSFSEYFNGSPTGTSFYVPVVSYCTDNASYIAAAGFYNYKPRMLDQVQVKPEMSILEKP
ncbi:tRNA (adenosine(37)-N6)-threonylcarbamoyltransferase complex transferase subunit TsaD [Candidatus Woesebacteria bacterium RIFOXYB1_FULL_38_16]|uniref:tRNA N6-adenosine threonylcarbamoyltransferase n=1 Tax=Candidatus Woesebacteria bacterium RIFOXYB1_FULL_38_16 TaxID=1802538 RepID=A0A1F8CTY5_9BACT|nr:MAG: tRNA (adenosine(37)-N6)-threonylcarbamoyltransferase complex transferase subunit TsaD [Candidatus Woesebacteria bacterium RIFOXYA1_FULL_38_9]OGM79793.1 MAG: tRNA (adenosine(37)-N6)-threonylcarbamoyltransferase complex transferase subunit TsaD [Candidatus Woesebacteria bacterium RIFOXYB1_FULL_38_16]